MVHQGSKTYWQTIWRQFKKKKTGLMGLVVVILFSLIAVFAPFLASSKPLFVYYDGQMYFPLFRYLLFNGFYTKNLDLFFNLLIFTLPPALVMAFIFRKSAAVVKNILGVFAFFQGFLFITFLLFPLKNPASDVSLTRQRQQALAQGSVQKTWGFDLRYMNDYAKLNLILRYWVRKQQHDRINSLIKNIDLPTLWQKEKENNERILKGKLKKETSQWYQDRNQWLEEQSKKITFIVMPLLRDFHWEDDAGGSQALNREVPFMELTRINRKDFVAALIFGIRVSLVVGVIAVALSLLIGIPVGSLAGYYAGKIDIIVSRLLEIWEAMPTFLMLLMVVALAQSKSIFLVISVIGIFGWTGFSRYIRAEFFKQRNLSYIEACQSLGFSDARIIFRHILPNAIPPVLTLLPFAIMAAISSEAGLSFLGLGEEGSCSWGVLMDEGRSAFPGESYLLWPPAILLTILLIAAALVGDALRDAFDPKMHN